MALNAESVEAFYAGQSDPDAAAACVPDRPMPLLSYACSPPLARTCWREKLLFNIFSPSISFWRETRVSRAPLPMPLLPHSHPRRLSSPTLHCTRTLNLSRRAPSTLHRTRSPRVMNPRLYIPLLQVCPFWCTTEKPNVSTRHKSHKDPKS